MKVSNQSLDRLLGNRKTVRHNFSRESEIDPYFENPIIHQQIQGDKVYVPLNLTRVWNAI